MKQQEKPAQKPNATQSHLKQSQQLQKQVSIFKRSKNEEPIRINADDQSKKAICIYVISIILPLVFALLIAVLALPQSSQHIYHYQTLPGTNLAICQGYVYEASTNPGYLSCFSSFTPNTTNSVGMYIRRISNLNQLLLFYLDLAPYARKMRNSQINFNEAITFRVYSASLQQSTKIKVDTVIYETLFKINQSFQFLRQNKILLGVATKLASDDQLYWNVVFPSNSSIVDPSDFYLRTKTIKQGFTIFTILLRVGFFILSLAFFIHYTSRLLKIPKHKISIQQKLIQILGAFTLTFNDQLYFVTVLWPNPFNSFISAVFIWNFFFGLFALWACFLIRIYYEQSATETEELRKPHRVVPFVIFYLCGLAFSAAFAIIQSENHPTLSPNSYKNGFFQFLLGATIVGFILTIFYLIYLYSLIKCQKNLLAYRNGVFMNISLLFFIGVVIVLGFGSLDVFTFSTALVIFTFSINNLYSYLLQYLYSPTPQQIQKFSLQQEEYHPNPRLLFENDELQTIDIDLALLDSEGSEKRSEKGSENGSEKGSERDSENRSVFSQKGSRRHRKRHNITHQELRQKPITSKNDKGESKEKILKDEEPYYQENPHEEIEVELE